MIRVIITGTLSYIAPGSIFSTLTLSKDVALAEGVVALTLLVILQFIIAWLSIRSLRFQQIVKGPPTLLFYRGQYLHNAMRAERIPIGTSVSSPAQPSWSRTACSVAFRS